MALYAHVVAEGTLRAPRDHNKIPSRKSDTTAITTGYARARLLIAIAALADAFGAFASCTVSGPRGPRRTERDYGIGVAYLVPIFVCVWLTWC